MLNMAELKEEDNIEGWDVDIDMLIKLVQNFPQLYDHGHKNFKNAVLRESTWEQIAIALKVPVDDCLRIWKNVRDKYTREKRILRSSRAPNEIPPSKWEFYESMKFLNPFIKRRKKLSLRRKKSPLLEENDASEGPLSSPSHSTAWQTVKLSPKSFALLEEDFEVGSVDMEEVTLEAEMVDDSPPRTKDVTSPPNRQVSVVRHQTSEEAFGAYIASRLLEFPPEIRQIKKAKLFRDLEEPEEV